MSSFDKVYIVTSYLEPPGDIWGIFNSAEKAEAYLNKFSSQFYLTIDIWTVE